MTPNEARKCWCPFARVGPTGAVVIGGQGGANRPAVEGGTLMESASCIADKCMAWRWWTVEMALRERIPLSAAEEGQGCCGLAGKW